MSELIITNVLSKVCLPIYRLLLFILQVNEIG